MSSSKKRVVIPFQSAARLYRSASNPSSAAGISSHSSEGLAEKSAARSSSQPVPADGESPSSPESDLTPVPVPSRIWSSQRFPLSAGTPAGGDRLAERAAGNPDFDPATMMVLNLRGGKEAPQWQMITREELVQGD